MNEMELVCRRIRIRRAFPVSRKQNGAWVNASPLEGAENAPKLKSR